MTLKAGYQLGAVIVIVRREFLKVWTKIVAGTEEMQEGAREKYIF